MSIPQGPPNKMEINYLHSMFLAALCTRRANIWKQPKYRRIDVWIKKWFIYTMEYYSTKRNDKIIEFASEWRDLLSEVSQRGEIQTLNDLARMWDIQKQWYHYK